MLADSFFFSLLIAGRVQYFNFNFSFIFLVDEKFIEERRRSLKRYLQILCRHPIIYDTEIIKFFLTFQGTVCIFYQLKLLFLIYFLQ